MVSARDNHKRKNHTGASMPKVPTPSATLRYLSQARWPAHLHLTRKPTPPLRTELDLHLLAIDLLRRHEACLERDGGTA